MPDAVSVIPDVSNRESRVFPKQGYTNEGREKKTGFPLTNVGNDRGRIGNDRGRVGNDRDGIRNDRLLIFISWGASGKTA